MKAIVPWWIKQAEKAKSDKRLAVLQRIERRLDDVALEISRIRLTAKVLEQSEQAQMSELLGNQNFPPLI